MAYTVLLRPPAERELRAFLPPLRRRINETLLALEGDPRPPGVVKLSGHPNRWRVRVGDYRILYEIDDAAQQILILRIAHRREVYR